MVKVVNATNTIYTDQTGRLPVQSSHGNKLVMILFDVDANYIDAEPLADSKDTSPIKAYKSLWERITKTRMHKPKMHILDNEASAVFKSEIRKNCDLQLIPPDTAGKTNLANYFMKHHPTAHHRNMRVEFLTQLAELQKLRETRSAGLSQPKSAARVC